MKSIYLKYGFAILFCAFLGITHLKIRALSEHMRIFIKTVLAYSDSDFVQQHYNSDMDTLAADLCTQIGSYDTQGICMEPTPAQYHKIYREALNNCIRIGINLDRFEYQKMSENEVLFKIALEGDFPTTINYTFEKTGDIHRIKKIEHMDVLFRYVDEHRPEKLPRVIQ